MPWYCDPSAARFLSRDPLAAQTREPYGYVNDNPLNGGDPSGLNSTSMSPDAQHCDQGGTYGGVNAQDHQIVCGDGTWYYSGHDVTPHEISPGTAALIIGAAIAGAACLFGGCEAAGGAAAGAATARYAAQATVAALGLLGIYGIFSKSHDVGEPTDPGLPAEPGGFDNMPGPGPTATPCPAPIPGTPTPAPVDGPFLPSPTPWGPWAP
jgi:hypothetical protein